MTDRTGEDLERAERYALMADAIGLALEKLGLSIDLSSELLFDELIQSGACYGGDEEKVRLERCLGILRKRAAVKARSSVSASRDKLFACVASLSFEFPEGLPLTRLLSEIDGTALELQDLLEAVRIAKLLQTWKNRP